MHALVLSISFISLDGLLFLILMPPTHKEKCEKKEVFTLQGVNRSDVCIFISENSVYLPWYNAVSKEIGPCKLISCIEENFESRLIIVPYGSKLSKLEIDILLKRVENGVSLLFECPDEKMTSLTGLKYAGKKSDCTEKRFLKNPVDLTGANFLIYVPIVKELDTEQRPYFFEGKIGKGNVFTLAIEYGKWAINTTQGKPDMPEGKFSKKLGWDMQGIQTPNLRTDSEHPFMFMPVLDIFDQSLFGHIRDKLKIPAWWYYPQSKSNAFILTFDEDWYGRRIQKLSAPGIPSTWFLVNDSNVDEQTVNYIKKQDGTIQFHWNRFILHLNQFGWHFCLRSAKKQIHKLSQKILNNPIVCRIHYLRWDSDFDNLFFVMKEAGIKIDSSFGPGRHQHGYRFGTGFPYFVSDKRGNPIGVQEIPFQIHEPMGGASLEDNIRLLDESEKIYHTIIVGLFHPYYCLSGGKSYKLYINLLDILLKRPTTWFTTIDELIAYWDKRRGMGIFSRFEENDLVINFHEIKDDRLALRLPDIQNIECVIINDIKVPVNDRLVLKAKNTTVRIRYRI